MSSKEHDMEKMSEMKTWARMALLAGVGVALAALSGCARIETGAVGIVKSRFNGAISDKPVTGFTGLLTESLVGEVDVTETRVPLNDLRPADAKGVQVEDMDLMLSIRLDGEKVPGFYIQTKELDQYRDESGKDVSMVGLNVIKNIAAHAVQEIMKTRQMSTLAANQTAFETEVKKQVQLELDKGYPGVFQVVRVNVNNLKLPAAVADQASKMAMLEMENERIDRELQLAQKRQQAADQAAAIDAKALRQAMQATGLSAEQLIAWKNAKSYGEQAAALGAKATVTIEAAKQPPAK